jgi:lactate dehydrogenase-like 2-hydroxyacid dehydrogenase
VQAKLYSPQQLPELMSVCDYVVMATPYTPSTHQLINAAAIAAMKPNAVLVNVGRGKCIDEAALIDGEAHSCCTDRVPATSVSTACAALAVPYTASSANQGCQVYMLLTVCRLHHC